VVATKRILFRQRNLIAGIVRFLVAVLVLIARYVPSRIGEGRSSLPASSRGTRLQILRSGLDRFGWLPPFEVLREPSTKIFGTAMLGASPNLG